MEELDVLLASHYFRNSKRYPALLRYVVIHTLDGNIEKLKERTLGIEVFDRQPSYDTSSDTVVRYTASEVRKRLQLYYHELDTVPEWQFELPPGSYTPRFVHSSLAKPKPPDVHSAQRAVSWWEAHDSDDRPLKEDTSPALEVDYEDPTSPHTERTPLSIVTNPWPRSRTFWIGFVALLSLSVGIITKLKAHKVQPAPVTSAVHEFWRPFLDSSKDITLCTGASVFADATFSGTRTAGRDEEYPFISFQIAEGLTKLGELFGANGKKAQVLPAASTPLSALRDRPLVLIGGYNNQWTIRLTDGLRYRFRSDRQGEALLDSAKPDIVWARERSLPYASADDYALITRFRNGPTGDWVVVLAGLGRNGTEAAAQFVTDEHFLEELRGKLKGNIPEGNLQIVLHLRVIDGKTGAPEMVAIYLW